MESRLACPACGKWMFHLAKTCPHCGTANGPPAPAAPDAKPATPPKKLEITADEARSLLAAVPAREPRMRDMAEDLVVPRSGRVDLVLSLIAMPVTVLTVVVLGYAVLQAMRKKAPINLRGARLLAVPTSAAFAALLLFQNDAPTGVWAALGLSLGAWLVRDVLRARAKVDPFS